MTRPPTITPAMAARMDALAARRTYQREKRASERRTAPEHARLMREAAAAFARLTAAAPTRRRAAR